MLKVPVCIPPCLSLAGELSPAQTVTCTWGALTACRLITAPLLPGQHLEMVRDGTEGETPVSSGFAGLAGMDRCWGAAEGVLLSAPCVGGRAGGAVLT